MSKSLTSYKIFIASPGGLGEERQMFHETINLFNKSAAHHEGVHFEPVGWEETLGGMGRPQSLINQELRDCDFFVLMLCDRWGSPTGDTTALYTSGTHEEYHVAIESHTAGTMKQLVVLFKKVDEKQLNDPGPQLQQVINFKKGLEQERSLFFQNFDSANHFKELLTAHLHQWLRWGRESAHNSNEPPKFPDNPKGPILAPASPDIPVSFGSSTNAGISSIITGWNLANEGKLTDAEIAFARAIINSPTPYNLIQYSDFLVRIGLLDRAQAMLGEAESLAQQQNNQQELASVYSSLGIILRIRGDIHKSEEIHRKGLSIDEELGDLKGMANGYGNLGIVLEASNNLEKAEEMHHKSLSINTQLGRLRNMASDYLHLGNISRNRGDLNKAEGMYAEALLLYVRLNSLHGVAKVYGNLGNIYAIRGQFAYAEKMHLDCLSISEKLGDLQGVSIVYNSLGFMFTLAGNMREAGRMFRKCLTVAKQLGNLSLSQRIAEALKDPAFDEVE